MSSIVSPFDWLDDALFQVLVGAIPEQVPNIEFKNLQFNPGGRKLWLKAINVPVTEDVATLGINGDLEAQGYLQVGFYQRIKEGTNLSKEAMAKVSKAFATGMRLPAPDGCMIRVESKGKSQGGQTSQADMAAGGTEQIWDATYLTIYWLAREPRSRGR